MESPKVGIITLPGQFNYGNRLQCYAVVRILQSAGFEPIVLDVEHKYRMCRELYKWMRHVAALSLGRSHERRPKEWSSGVRLSEFERFGELIPTQKVNRASRALRSQFKYFVVGSDQVWNPSYIKYSEHWYYAKFAARSQRISLAASLGVDDILNKRDRNRFIDGVRGFASISVREARCADIIKKYSGLDAEVICDPTLVLSAGDWRSVARYDLVPPEPYVFSYVLGEGELAETVLNQIVGRDQLKLVSLSDRQRPGELDAGPADFIALVQCAQHVVTDSFHAAVFSSIFERPLTIVRREGGDGIFSRLEHLASTLEIENKVLGSPSFDLSSAGDFEGVQAKIDEGREKFLRFIERSMYV